MKLEDAMQILRCKEDDYHMELGMKDIAERLHKAIQERDALSAVVERQREALQAARRFIVNGVALGFIRLPDADTPDPAHNTLPLIKAALALTPATAHRLHEAEFIELTALVDKVRNVVRENVQAGTPISVEMVEIIRDAVNTEPSAALRLHDAEVLERVADEFAHHKTSISLQGLRNYAARLRAGGEG